MKRKQYLKVLSITLIIIGSMAFKPHYVKAMQSQNSETNVIEAGKEKN